MTPLDRSVALTVAIVLLGFGFLGGRLSAPDQPVILSLEAAMAVTPPVATGGRLNPDYRDLAIAALQHAVDSAAREAALARNAPPHAPELAP